MALDTDKLTRLIKATDEYIFQLDKHKQNLEEAIDTCDRYMRQDSVYKKQKPKLEDAIDQINRSKQTAVNMKIRLEEKWKTLVLFIAEN